MLVHIIGTLYGERKPTPSSIVMINTDHIFAFVVGNVSFLFSRMIKATANRGKARQSSWL